MLTEKERKAMDVGYYWAVFQQNTGLTMSGDIHFAVKYLIRDLNISPERKENLVQLRDKLENARAELVEEMNDIMKEVWERDGI